MSLSLTLTLHILAAVLWVGGMFFAHMVLRPTAAEQLEPPQRLRLWVGVFGRFFPWVWVAIITLPATGYWALFQFFGGMAEARLYIHLMQANALVMIGLFLYLYYGPYAGLKRAVAAEMWPEGGQQLARIRQVVTINMLLGLITIAIAVGGRYY